MVEWTTTKYPVIVLSSINWDYLWQRHQILATCFARAGHRVVFVEGLAFGSDYLDPSYYMRAVRKFWRVAGRAGSKSARRKLPRNLTLYPAVTAPLRPSIFRWCNEQIFVPRILREIASMGIKNPVVWSFQPTDTTMQIARGLEPRALVYDCVMNFAQAPGMPKDIFESEEEWVNAADLVVVDSVFLRQKHAIRRPDVVQIPPGVDYELFNQAYSVTVPGTPVRKVCFFGGMGENWFDFDLVENIADAGFSVSLIGHKATQHRLLDHPNVTYAPPVPQAELPALLKPTDALLIPYKINPFTQGVFPSKVYECLATGKPVIAPPLPDLRGELSKHLYLADGAEEFVDVLRRLPELETQEKVWARLALARENSWESRFASISRELERVPHA